MIDNKYIIFKTKSAFDNQRRNGNINPESVVFIEDAGLIYTHKHYYGGILADGVDPYATYDGIA